MNLRNDFGILPNGKTLFAMKTKDMKFYDFALFLKK